jgi:hypothetical protein
MNEGARRRSSRTDGDDLMKASCVEFESLTVVSRVNAAAPSSDERA